MRVILVAAFLGMASTAQAGFYTGNDLYLMCEQKNPVLYGYAAGWIDKQTTDTGTMDIVAKRHTDDPVMSIDQMLVSGSVCYPPNMVLQQPHDIICKYLEAHPEVRQNSADALTYVALSEAWPCKK